ncbi:MAG: magnesium transporter CorA, partial [Acidobacteria bacterium]|nr:magnesium transporter CorA [Acidobacteriota bacterium]
MKWHEIRDPNDAELDRLAEQYHLHSLHVEDCRHRGQSAKVEENDHYLFAVLKPVAVAADGSLAFGDLDLFLGRDFLITMEEPDCSPCRQLLEMLRPHAPNLRADQLFYRIMDAVVDSYLPVLDRLGDL